MRRIALAMSLVLIFMIPWEDVVNISGLGTATRSMGLLVAAVWFATVLITGRFRKPGSFHVLAWIFVLWNALSVFWSADPSRTAGQLVTWVQLFALAIIIWDLYTTPAAVMAALQVYVFGAYVAIVNTISDFVAGKTYYYERFSATGTNPDDLGFVLVLGLPVASYLAASANGPKPRGLLKVVNYGYIPCALLGVVLSGTRTAMVAALPGLAFGLASLTRLKVWTRVAILLLLVGVALVSLPELQGLPSFQRLTTTGSELAGGDLNGRLIIWRDGLSSFVQHPLFGVGSYMYRSVNRLRKVAHNSFISVLVETGMIGFTLFGLMLAFVVAEVLRQHTWDAIFWLSVLVVWAIGASTLTFEYRKPTWLFFSLIVASAAGATARAREGSVESAYRAVAQSTALPD